ncbi:MAG: HlyD family efflux transporter periplasmic adaptor subunit [Saprospiraceae bacterium]
MKRILIEIRGAGYLTVLGLLAGIMVLPSCRSKQKQYKASGIFEAKEIIVSAESGGKIEQLNIEDGMKLNAGQLVGAINCSQQELIAQQANESLKSLSLKTNDASANVKVLEQQKTVQENQVKVIEDQLATALREENRIQKLVTAQAVPSKQLDDIQSARSLLQKQIESSKSQLNVIQEQINAARQNVATQNKAILSEKSPMEARIQQLKDLEKKCQIINPINGTVLTQYTYAYEVANMGKALYKIANLDTLFLKAYITGTQLGDIKLNQSVDIIVNQGKEEDTQKGTITWISDKAEFTPKSIMTVDERANLIYPIKIKTPNGGKLKIGLFAEVNW